MKTKAILLISLSILIGCTSYQTKKKVQSIERGLVPPISGIYTDKFFTKEHCEKHSVKGTCSLYNILELPFPACNSLIQSRFIKSKGFVLEALQGAYYADATYYDSGYVTYDPKTNQEEEIFVRLKGVKEPFLAVVADENYVSLVARGQRVEYQKVFTSQMYKNIGSEIRQPTKEFKYRYIRSKVSDEEIKEELARWRADTATRETLRGEIWFRMYSGGLDIYVEIDITYYPGYFFQADVYYSGEDIEYKTPSVPLGRPDYSYKVQYKIIGHWVPKHKEWWSTWQ